MIATAKCYPHMNIDCSAGKEGAVLSVDIASQKAIHATPIISGRETLPLLVANQRVCAKPVRSPNHLPLFANSAMDGYAIRHSDLNGSGPWTLPVSGRIVAGSKTVPPLQPGSVMRIMTGAPIPKGADCVIMQEYCEPLENAILIRQKPTAGKHIRLPGEDVRRSTVLVEPGQFLTPRHLALLAASGCASVYVLSKVRVGLISTGSELIEPGTTLTSGQIYNSNRYYLKARLDRPWIETIDYGIVEDDPLRIQNCVRKAASECDVIITTGGVSTGEEDHMVDVLKREAAELNVLKVAMRPGKPVTVGRLGSAMYFGLPGNPYACATTFMKIAWPAIRKSGGLEPQEGNKTKGVAGFHYARKPGRTEYVPVSWSRSDEYGRPVLERLGKGASASLHPFAMARAIAAIPPEIAEIDAGDILLMEPVDF
jgi:molybdopterin molybdotransferase